MLCLDRVTEITEELKRLMKEFEKELVVLKARVDGLEAQTPSWLQRFSTTTKLSGVSFFWLGGASYNDSVTALLVLISTAVVAPDKSPLTKTPSRTTVSPWLWRHPVQLPHRASPAEHSVPPVQQSLVSARS